MTEPVSGLPPLAAMPPEPKVERVTLSPRSIPPVAPEPRRPAPTPAPWDGGARRPAADLGPADRSERDRPTDPRGAQPTATLDRATVPRPRPDDNPTARALSPPSPPALELTFSEAHAAEPDRSTDAPTSPLPTRRPQVTAPKADSSRRYEPAPALAAVTRDGPLGDAPPPRRTMIARRAPSRAPIVLVVLAIAGALGGGGYWAVQQRNDTKGVIAPIPKGIDCPAGMIGFAQTTFKQGSDKLDPDRDVFEPVLQDAKVGSFCVDRFEHPNREGSPPTTGVDYATAAKTCEIEGKRLCSELEWEHACKGAAETRFPFGDSFKSGICNVGSDDGKAAANPGPSGAFAACGAEKGPRDMSGNVWELTSSVWPEDASARIIKGGSAKVPAWGARCAYRDFVALAKPAPDVGFRCCKDP